VRREEAGERRDDVRAAVVVDSRASASISAASLMMPEVVAQPLHQRPGDGDRALERVDRRGVADPVADRR
jgi:hypothetical protein